MAETEEIENVTEETKGLKAKSFTVGENNRWCYYCCGACLKMGKCFT